MLLTTLFYWIGRQIRLLLEKKEGAHANHLCSSGFLHESVQLRSI